MANGEIDAELLDALRALLEPALLLEVRKAGEAMKEGGEALIDLHNRLAELLAQAKAA